MKDRHGTFLLLVHLYQYALFLFSSPGNPTAHYLSKNHANIFLPIMSKLNAAHLLVFDEPVSTVKPILILS